MMMNPEDRIALRIVCSDHPWRVLARPCVDTSSKWYLYTSMESPDGQTVWMHDYDTPGAHGHHKTGRPCPQSGCRHDVALSTDRVDAVIKAAATIALAPRTWTVTDTQLATLLGAKIDDWPAADVVRALDHCHDTRWTHPDGQTTTAI